MSHSEFMKSLHENDGRKWLFEERNGQEYYIDITDGEKNPYRSNQPGWAVLRERKVRAQMRKKVRVHEKPYAWRLGYNICSGQYTGEQEVPILSGSSLNRKIPDKKSAAKKSAELPVHVMSKRSKAKIRDKATAFFRVAPDRIFCTLTFIQYVGDRESKRILNKFLTVVRKEVKGFEYLVISEHHPKREGHCIHFHMLCSRRLTIQRYNALWTLQQYNAGLVGHRANGETISRAEIDQRYLEGTIGKVLNPVKIEKAYCLSAISWYLTKYVSKQETGEQFGCLTWSCSRKVSRLFTSQLVSPSTFRYMLSFRNYKVNRSTGEMWAPQRLSGAFFMLVFVNNKPAAVKRLGMLETVNKWIIEKFIPDRTLGISNEQYRKLFMGRDLQFDAQSVVG